MIHLHARLGVAGSQRPRWLPTPLAAIVVAGVIAAVVASPLAADAAGSTISAHMGANSITLGQTTSIAGTVTPSHATSRVVVQRRVAGRWGDRQAGPVASDGTFKLDLKPSQAGIYALRVRSVDGTLLSNVVYVRVQLSAAQAIRAVDFVRFPYPADTLCGSSSEQRVDVGPVGQSQVSYGDLSGDGVEEAAIVVECEVEGGTLHWSRLLIYQPTHGAPKLVTAWDPVTAPASDWPPAIFSASISHEIVTVKGMVSPPGACHACQTEPWSSRLALHNGKLQPA